MKRHMFGEMFEGVLVWCNEFSVWATEIARSNCQGYGGKNHSEYEK